MVKSFWDRLPSVLRLVVSNIAFTGTTFLTGVIMARALLPEGRGQFASLTIWAVAVAQVGLLGIHHFLSRQGGQKPAHFRALYRLGYIIICVISPILMVFYAIGMWLLLNPENFESKICIVLSALIIPGSAINAFQSYMELGRQAFGTYGFCRLAFSLLFFIFSCYIYIAGISTFSVYLIAYTSATILSSLIAAILIYQQIKIHPYLLPSLNWRDVLMKSREFNVAIVFSSFASQGDKLLLSTLLPASEFGLFVVASSVAQILHMIGEALAQLFFSRLITFRSVSEIDKTWITSRLRQAVIIYSLIVIVAMFLLPPLLPIVYGSEFTSAASALLILLPAVGIRAIVRLYEEIYRGLGYPKISTAILASGVVVMMISMIVVANNGYGFLAFAWVVLLGNAVSLVFALAYSRISLGLTFTAMLVPRRSDFLYLMNRAVSIISR